MTVLLLQAITAGVLAGVSDSVAQKLSGFEKLQMKRLLLKMVTRFYLTSLDWLYFWFCHFKSMFQFRLFFPDYKIESIMRAYLA